MADSFFCFLLPTFFGLNLAIVPKVFFPFRHLQLPFPCILVLCFISYRAPFLLTRLNFLLELFFFFFTKVINQNWLLFFKIYFFSVFVSFWIFTNFFFFYLYILRKRSKIGFLNQILFFQLSSKFLDRLSSKHTE